MRNLEFEEQAQIERVVADNQWAWQCHLREVRGEDIYTRFCLWCNCQGKGELRKNARVFAEWLKTEKIVLTEFQRRCIAENHFNWKFVFNKETQRWEGKEIKE